MRIVLHRARCRVLRIRTPTDRSVSADVSSPFLSAVRDYPQLQQLLWVLLRQLQPVLQWPHMRGRLCARQLQSAPAV